jgi:ABC-2 type transport system permease protein
MRPEFAIAIKDLRLMLRDRPGMVFTLLFPLLFGLFFGAIYAGTAEGDRAPISLVVVDRSQGNGVWSARLVDHLGTDEGVQFSEASSVSEAEASLVSGDAAAILEFAANHDDWFESFGLVASGAPRLIVAPAQIGQEQLIHGKLSAAMHELLIASLSDPVASRKRAEELQRLAASSDTPRQEAMRLAAAASAIQMLGDAGDPDGQQPRTGIRSEVLVRPEMGLQPPNSFAITFPQAIMWAILGCAATFAVGLVGERHSGTLVRLRTMPISAAQILAGKGLACMAVSLTVSLAFVGVSRLFLDVRPVSYPMLLLALCCVSFAFAGMMMLLAVLGRSKTSPGQLAWGVILIMAITGGGMLPLFFMPQWLVSISHFSPVKWGILAIEGGIWRGTPLIEMIQPLGILIGIGIAGFVIGAKWFVLSERLSS